MLQGIGRDHFDPQHDPAPRLEQAEVASIGPSFNLFRFTHDRFDHIFGTTCSAAKKDGPIRSLAFVVALLKFAAWACGEP